MDKKFIGLIAAMLLLSVLIFLWPAVFATDEEDSKPESFNAAYIERFFDKNRVIDVRVELEESDFEDMMQNPLEEEYKVASVVVDGEKVENVGFRTKGNSSLRSVAGSDSERYSFKIDFNQYIKIQNLDGLTKLNLNNSFSDPSFMREYLSYSLLSEMGVPTPAFAYVNVYVNGELIGLYLAVEGIEEPFMERYYGSNYGTLYKPYGEHGKGTDFVYTDDNIESYSGLQAVTEEKNGSDEALIEMIKMLNQGSDLETYLDVDEILRYFAVNTVLVNMDSYQGQFTHNYYICETDGVFSILPWDYNMSFGGFGMGGRQGEQTALYIDQPFSGTNMEERPLLGKLLEVEEYKELYHQYIEEFINGPFALGKMTAEIEEIASMIRPYLEQDPSKFYTMEQFEQAIAEGSAQQNTVAANESEARQEGTPGQLQDERKMAPDQEKPAFPAVQPENMEELADPGDTERRRGGGGMMQGNNAIGLLKFVRERISNVEKQLSGELPSVGDISESPIGGFMPGQAGEERVRPDPQGDWEGQNPPDKMQGRNEGQRLPAMEMQNRPEGNGFHGKFPENMENGMPGHREVQQPDNSEQKYIIAGSLLLLLITTFVLLRKKTKYSI